jgi:penicillin-binding protein 2
MWVGGNSDTFSERRFRGRVRGISFVFAVGCAIILLRLFDLQVVHGNDMAQLSQSNSTQVIFLRAPRGDFYDAKGRPIVLNRPSWSLMYSVPDQYRSQRQAVQDALMPFLSPFPPVWTRRLQRAHQTGQMVRLVEDVPNEVAFLMREMEHLFPGLRVVMEFRRGYPLGNFAAHLIGYLGEVSERELRNQETSDLKPGDLVGKMGLEKTEDAFLRGEDGGMLIEVDSVGRLKRVIKQLPFRKGGEVHLTLDLDMQKVAEQALSETPTGRGAAVAIDVRTGAVIVWASAPSFDPLGSLAEYLHDPAFPFLDRCYRGAYPPGSVFKIVTAITGFEKGLIDPNKQVECKGFLTLKDKGGTERKFRCWKSHGWVNFWSAMAQSCDTYFYLLGKDCGSQSIYETADAFGLGHPVQSTLSGENKGNIPNPLWKKRIGLGGWTTGDTYNMAIGQGYDTATPLQLAVLMEGIANRGRILEPYFVQKLVDVSGKTVMTASPRNARNVTLKESTWDLIDRSLEAVVESGTAAGGRVVNVDIRGKTGTAQNPHGEDHAWFAAYAGPRGEPPQLAICVFVENGGHGGVVSVPIAKKIIESAFPVLKPEAVQK